MTKEIIPHNPLEGSRPELTMNLHENSDEQVSIVVVHKDRPAYLSMCLQSINVTSINNNYELIVVDNNSEKDTQDFLDELEQDGIKVIRNNKNLYWSASVNRGVEAASRHSKYLVFMHADVIITNPSWLDLLISVSESQKSGLIGLELQSYYMQQQKIDFVQEWCMLTTRECWETAGPFPEKLPQIGHSFIYTIKAQHGGFKPQVMKNTVAHHYRIFSMDINEYEKMVEASLSQIPALLREIQSNPVR